MKELRGRSVAMAMLPPPATKPITLHLESGFSYRGGGGNETYAKPRTKGREVSYGKIGLTTVAATRDLFSGMQLVLKLESSTFGTVYYKNQDNLMPNS